MNQLTRLVFFLRAGLTTEKTTIIGKLFKNLKYNVEHGRIELEMKDEQPNKPRLNTIFNTGLVSSVNFSFAKSIVEYYESFSEFTSVFDEFTLNIRTDNSDAFFRAYQMFFQDIVTCACLKNKVLKSRVVEVVDSGVTQSNTRAQVAKALREKDLIFGSDLTGVCIRGPTITQVYKGVEDLFVKIVCDQAKEVLLPKVVSTRDLIDTGHLRRFGRELLYVSEAKNRQSKYTVKLLNNSSFDRCISQEFCRELKKPDKCLTYSQCDTVWNMFRNKVIIEKNLPLLLFDRSGYSYRNEGGAVFSIERLSEFKRLELIYLTTLDLASQTYKVLLNKWKTFLGALGLTYGVLDVESWSGVWGANINTNDFEFKFAEGRTLEIGNLSINSSKYVDKFNIRGNKKSSLVSGCSGLGVDRVVFVLHCVYGLDLQNWPSEIRRLLNIKVVDSNKLFA